MTRHARWLSAAVLVWAGALAGCAAPTDQAATPQAAFERLAAQHDFAIETLNAGQFRLTGALRLREPSNRLVVYIEGDGRAWLDRTTLAPDPTPTEPLVLGLAARDPAPATAYLARPCQYLDPAGDATCAPRYWSSHRYGDAVIASMADAIDQLAARAGAKKIELVGYSGGAAIAVLVAARRTDIAGLITVAGILDHRSWTDHHGVTPLTGSRNPAELAPRVATIPQLHLIGANDRVVPPRVVRDYIDRLPMDAPVDMVALPGHDHDCCWTDAWPDLLARYRPLIDRN